MKLKGVDNMKYKEYYVICNDDDPSDDPDDDMAK